MPASTRTEPELVDLMHRGSPRVIGAWLLGEIVFDPGPSTCLDALLPVLERTPPRVIALTHVHLDHAGASGTLARRFPAAEVWVHERGAPHLADPARLLASSTRLYGDDMERLWGEVLPVPAERLRVLRGGERLGDVEVAYTPGHAVHHVAYLHTPTRCAITGDIAGVRIGAGPVLAPTPPPDIDLDAWRRSLDVLDAWRPRSLAIAHFGSHDDVGAHVGALRDHLDEVERLAGSLDEAGFAAAMAARVALGGEGEAASYGTATSAGQNYRGLRRYLERRAAADAGPR